MRVLKSNQPFLFREIHPISSISFITHHDTVTVHYLLSILLRGKLNKMPTIHIIFMLYV